MRRRWSTGALLVVSAAIAATIVARPVSAGPPAIEEGGAVIVSASDAPLAEGGSATPFTLQLPDGAACPGDSAFAGWRVNSFLVPEGVDVASLPFDGLGPTPFGMGAYDTLRQPLYDRRTTENFASALTGAVATEGEPGPIVDLPLFSFEVFRPGNVPPGRYRIGITCTYLNEVGRAWTTKIDIRADATDRPAGIRWAVVDAPAREGRSNPIALAAPALALGSLLVMWRTRSRSRSKEERKR